MFKMDEEYSSTHTGEDKLKVVHIYNPEMCKMNVVGTSRHFIGKDRATDGKHIPLAHIPNKDTELHRVEERIIKW